MLKGPCPQKAVASILRLVARVLGVPARCLQALAARLYMPWLAANDKKSQSRASGS